jgi:DNA-binding CsgD family transcriptional regulator/tetratricopeptide (TPR) repeat protein
VAEWLDVTVGALPGQLRLEPPFPFVGRSSELAALRSLLPRAEGEGRRVALLGGEPGGGKSRLVRELAHEAWDDSALVLYGGCDSVVGSPYQPIVEALEQIVRTTPPGELRVDLGRVGGELARLVPDLGSVVDGLPDPVPADADTARHRLHVVVADLLTNTGRRHRVLLVLEDLHWADEPTLSLIRHLVRTAGDARLLLVATYRESDAQDDTPLGDLLADLRRSDAVTRLRITGLNPQDTTEFVRRASGCERDDELIAVAASVRDLTQGNPFLVSELWRMLVESGAVRTDGGRLRLVRSIDQLSSPESVREVVSQRLRRLDPATTELLEVAAVAGPEFDLDTIAADGVSALAAAGEGVLSGMIQEVPGRLHAYRFTHELVRRALYDRLTAPRRAALHLRVAEALERETPSPQGRALADLAYHFTAAGPLAREPAIAYSIRAAEAASSSLAFEEAASRLRAALDLGIRDGAERTDVLLRLGSALRHEGRWPEALSAYAQAADTARGIGDTELFARAAVGFEEASWRPALAGETARDLLEEAAADLDDDQSTIRVEVLASLCRALAYIGEDEQASVVRAEAAELAREIGAREGLALVQSRSYWARGSLSLGEVLDVLGEARDLGQELGDIDVRADAMGWRVVTLAALGELDAARRELAVALEASAQARQPFNLHICEQFGSALALSDGRLAEAEKMAERSREWGELLRGRDASGAYGVQMFGLRREQGRLAELAPVVRLLAGEPRSGPWLPGMAALLTELGMHDEAQVRLDPLRRDGLDQLRESLWVASLTYLADAYAVLPGDDLAIRVYEQLAPLRGTNAMVGHLVAFLGAVDRYLGVLAASVGEWDTAEEHLQQALTQNRAMGATTWVAHTLYQQARVLYLRGAADDRGRAGELALEAGRLARTHGLHALAARVERSDARGSGSALPDDLSPREVEVLQLVAQGMSNREIGAALHISEHTAANHMRSILRKTGSANRTEATSYAHRRGLTRIG